MIIALQQVPAALGVQAAGEQVVLVAIRAVGDWLAAPDWVPWESPRSRRAHDRRRQIAAEARRPGRFDRSGGSHDRGCGRDVDIATIGALPSSFPAPTCPPSRSQTCAFSRHLRLLAALAALESLLSATVADAMSVSQRHDPDRELFDRSGERGKSAVRRDPATAAIVAPLSTFVPAQSATGGHRSPAILLGVVLALGRVVSLILLAALAGVLIATAMRMVEV